MTYAYLPADADTAPDHWHSGRRRFGGFCSARSGCFACYFTCAMARPFGELESEYLELAGTPWRNGIRATNYFRALERAYRRRTESG